MSPPVVLHRPVEGGICRCEQCLYQFTRLMIKLCPRSFRSRAFQFNPQMAVHVLNDGGDPIGLVAADQYCSPYVNHTCWIRSPYRSDTLEERSIMEVEKDRVKVNVEISTPLNMDNHKTESKVLKGEVTSLLGEMLRDIGAEGEWQATLTFFRVPPKEPKP